MYSLSDKQIDFILDDIVARGIGMVSLQQDLLDHICCIIEQNLEENGDFEHFYEQTISTFYKRELREIEAEAINLLTLKNYYVMKKIMLASGVVSSGLLTFGLILKFGHWPGASLCLVLGLCILSLIFLPLLFTLKIKEKRNSKEKVIVGLGAFAAVLISLGVLFKMMHWPFANMMCLAAIGIMLFLFLPVYFFGGIRNAETKVNTIVSSVLIIAGSGLMLALVRSPAGTKAQYAMNSANFFRNELILRSEQKQVGAIENNFAKSIFDQCESLKYFLIFSETGSKSIGPDFESKGELLSDSQAEKYFGQSPKMTQKLMALHQNIEAYNRSALAKQPVMLKATILEVTEKSVTAALNDFVQIQMMVLQNEYKPVVVK